MGRDWLGVTELLVLPLEFLSATEEDKLKRQDSCVSLPTSNPTPSDFKSEALAPEPASGCGKH
jgi:hypothetical protein